MILFLLQIDLLSHDDIDVRERATRELLARGHSAIPQLRAAMDSADPEVRSRAALIVRRDRPQAAPDREVLVRPPGLPEIALDGRGG
jgi:HEAT repeat protein